MQKLWIVTKNELMRYFISPLAYVYLLSFLILNASFAIYFGDFFNRGKADLLPMFEFLPWLYLLFIPGISMRLWAEEFRYKTIVQIITQPIAIRTLVIGKFLTSWLFCGLALLLTFPFWLTVNILGEPDNGVIALGYFAALILAGCMLAISQTMSALTKNQVIALVLAVIANLFFFWSGVEYILSFFRLFLPDSAIDTIASFSFVTHFSTMTKGLVELRDIIFFAAVIIFFNFTTILVVNFKTAGTSGWLKSTSRSYYIFAWLMLLTGFFGINILANNLTRQIQYDATAEKIYTLTSSTKDVLNRLPEPIMAKLYFSPILEQRNPNLRQLFDNIRLLLQKYKTAAKDNFTYKIYYPKFLSQEEDIALADGLQAIPLIDLNQNALFGLTLEDTLQNKQIIPFFAQQQLGAIEQDITAKIYQMYHQKKTIGIITGLPIFGYSEAEGVVLHSSWEIIRVLQENYSLQNITKAEDLTDDIAAVVLLNPQNLTDDMVEKIKKYSQSGGKFLLILDPANEASRLYAPATGMLQSSQLGDLANFWGINFYADYVVADLQNSITVDSTINYNTNPVFSQDVIQFKVPQKNMNPYHPITKNLHEMMLASASVVMPNQQDITDGKIKFVPLLRAGDISSIMTSKVVIDGLNPQQVLQYFAADDNQKILAAEVSGQTAENPFEMIIITDSDFLYDSFWADKQHFLEKEYTFNSFDNANFVLNALDYLTYDQTMLNLRGKRANIRRFNDIENLRRINSLTFKQKENAVFAEINHAKAALNEVWNKKNFEERENFSADELAAISGVRHQLDDLREQLSELRYNAFRNIKKIADKVALFNIALVPAIIILVLLINFGFKHYFHRQSIGRHSQKSAPYFDIKLMKLSLICVLLLILGAVSVYLTNRSEADAYENRLLFPDLTTNLNNINKVVLKTNKQTLTFVYKNNLWHLQEMPSLPVYQERIRRLLTTIAEATYFAKKSNKAQNLAMFNLAPLEDEHSKVTEISLFSDNGPVNSFYLGDINIDLGRGAMSAYMRLADQFQVWQIKADFINMNLDWHNWTYSHLWDLRFGRLIAPSATEHEEQVLVILLKELLNTEIMEVSNKPNINPQDKIVLNVEEGNKVTMAFYMQNDDAWVTFDFAKNNTNKHLKLWAQYLENKAAKVDKIKLEKIIEFLKQYY
ncbi:MAG: Gldg family protein [Alphaproteobacteria bacterium]|nr:Gldg family protein [Alphaproteobacteria bacterium]